jgi:hypothetical protein
MNDIPTKCVFCGTPRSAEIHGMLTFRCGSVWFLQSQKWLQFSGCERTVLRARIGRAIESLKVAERFDLRPMGNFLGDGMVRDDKHGEWTEAEILDKVLGILQGDSNE